MRIEVRHRNASRDVLGRPDLTQDAAPRVRRGEQDGIEVQLARRDHLEVAEQGGAFLKHVVVPGVLQDKSGPNVATEFGVLLPDSNGDSGVGASSAGIVSQRWDWGTVHFNAETALTPEHHTDFFVGTIIHALTNGHSVNEIRAGLTFAVPLRFEGAHNGN